MKKYVPYLTFLKIFLLFLTVVNDGACRAWTKRDARTPFRCGDEKIEGSKCHWNFWWPNCKSLKQIDQTMCWPTIGQLFSTNRHTPFAVTTHSINMHSAKMHSVNMLWGHFRSTENLFNLKPSEKIRDQSRTKKKSFARNETNSAPWRDSR